MIFCYVDDDEIKNGGKVGAYPSRTEEILERKALWLDWRLLRCRVSLICIMLVICWLAAVTLIFALFITSWDCWS